MALAVFSAERIGCRVKKFLQRTGHNAPDACLCAIVCLLFAPIYNLINN